MSLQTADITVLEKIILLYTKDKVLLMFFLSKQQHN